MKDMQMQIKEAVQNGDLEGIDSLVSKNVRTVRFLVGMSYQPDEKIRKTAASGIAIAGRYHKKMVKRVVRRLLWAMNEESATNAANAPEVILALAKEEPELLLHVLPEIVSLAADDGLKQGLVEAAYILKEKYPDKIGKSLTVELNKRINKIIKKRNKRGESDEEESSSI